MGRPLEDLSFTIPALSLPFAGFLIVGFLAAGLQKLRNFLRRPVPKKEDDRHE